MKEYKTSILLVMVFLLALFTLMCGPPSGGIEEEITNSIGMKLRLIPAGSFMMGVVPGDNEAADDEKPRHEVEITKPFCIGVYEVTQAQYEAVMGENPSDFKGSNRPVEMVSWHDAVEFCRKLSEKEGVTYRLPTEAEWEYAARGGGEGKKYVWGDQKIPIVNGVKQANVNDESGYRKYYTARKAFFEEYGYFEGYDDGYADTSPVASFTPNGYGLYDMAGNVWEWCSDWYDEDYYSCSPSNDPENTQSTDVRVLRSGSWGNGSKRVRLADRGRDTPTYRSNYIGLRIVRDVD